MQFRAVQGYEEVLSNNVRLSERRRRGGREEGGQRTTDRRKGLWEVSVLPVSKYVEVLYFLRVGDLFGMGGGVEDAWYPLGRPTPLYFLCGRARVFEKL
jgi:hypothetical protein